jgi:predicted NBD/HSP70 family sugar kinase
VKEGVCLIAPSLHWHDVPILEYLQEKLNLLVTVDNNVRCMALGEAFFGSGQNTSPLVFVYGRVGVGAGIVIDGMIVRGSGAGAGEIGHLNIKQRGGDLCRCGKHGCLETLVSELVFVREAQYIAEEHPDSLVAQYLSLPGDEKPIDRVFAAARDGDLLVQKMITERARYLGIGLSYLVNILDPELILLGGVFSQGKDLILPTAEETMREMAFAGLGDKVRVDATSFGWRAGVIGACALALTTFFYLEPVEI